MILSDSEIKKRINSGDIKIESQEKYDILEQVGPASFDFRLGNVFKIYKRKNITFIDPKVGIPDGVIKTYHLNEGEFFTLHPGDFILGATLEKFKIPYDLVARCEGRSSLGRLGLIIHSTAGFIDPGFEGTVTLEMTNINEIPIILHPGMRIGQLAFEKIFGTVENTYDKRLGSKYMGQILPEESKINNDLY